MNIQAAWGSPIATVNLPAGESYGKTNQLQFAVYAVVDTYAKPINITNNVFSGVCQDFVTTGSKFECAVYQLNTTTSSTPILISEKHYTDTINVNVQIIDTNNDGISDAWEQNYFGGVDAYPPTADPNGDGYTLLEDYQLGFDPTVVQPLDSANGFIVKPDLNQNTLYWQSVDRALSYDLYCACRIASRPNLLL